ncbi:high-affinity lysophosphatidic acid receptor-like [Mytilus californianus]|uniref:high-affinity lysophosphatidic acid receptor-like n=1 Tax=Mytilus californianus TaxID=6549 RepID=UPI002246B6EE|nr:high-affinity lysophosphatidic acid receptor-like [Mytilus californianus]
MASNFTNGTSLRLSEIEYQEFLDRGIPATIFLLFLSVVGTIGNIHTILVYLLSPIMAKYSVRVFIIWLAFIDLTACLFCMPFEIFDIRYNYTFSSVGACKFFRFLNHIVTVASGCLLTSIAIERYRSIIKNLPVLFANSQRSTVISASLVGLSMILSIPAIILYGLNEKETSMFGRTTKDCRILSEYHSILNVGVYYSILVIIGSVGTVMCIVSYGRILCKICTRKDWRESLGKKTDSSSNLSSETTKVISTIQNGEEKIMKVHIEKKKATRSSHNLGNAIQLTTSLMIATAISYIGYMLHVFTDIVKMLNPKMYQNIVRQVSQILLRGYFVNNAANPIVFCLLDRTFRQECLKLYGKTFWKKH